jgi:hypothetical protein
MNPLHLSGTGRDVLEFASISFSHWKQEACSALAVHVFFGERDIGCVICPRAGLGILRSIEF